MKTIDNELKAARFGRQKGEMQPWSLLCFWFSQGYTGHYIGSKRLEDVFCAPKASYILCYHRDL